MNSGTRSGTSAFARRIRLPLSKSAPLAICAFMILSVSSSSMGINRSAIDIIIATSCTGTLNSFRGRSPFSSPSVRLFGVVVRVIMEEPIISIVSRTAIVTAVASPSFVIVSFHMVTSASPGVRKRLNTTVINNRNTTALIPFTMNRKGTWDSPITNARNKAATR